MPLQSGLKIFVFFRNSNFLQIGFTSLCYNLKNNIMKNTTLFLFTIIITNLAVAQKLVDKNVPENVKTTFSKKYPEVKKVKWEKEAACFEADFEIKEAEYSVVIDAKGQILETEEVIPTSKLPKSVQDYVTKNYPNQKIKEAAIITNNKNVKTYEAEIKGKDLLFDSKGDFIKTVAD
jgi:hypothetical protein